MIEIIDIVDLPIIRKTCVIQNENINKLELVITGIIYWDKSNCNTQDRLYRKIYHGVHSKPTTIELEIGDRIEVMTCIFENGNLTMSVSDNIHVCVNYRIYHNNSTLFYGQYKTDTGL